MITAAVLDFFYGIVNAFYLGLPVWNMTANATQLAEGIQFLSAFNSILPISELIGLTSLWFTYLVCLHGAKWALKIVNVIRGCG